MCNPNYAPSKKQTAARTWYVNKRLWHTRSSSAGNLYTQTAGNSNAPYTRSPGSPGTHSDRAVIHLASSPLSSTSRTEDLTSKASVALGSSREQNSRHYTHRAQAAEHTIYYPTHLTQTHVGAGHERVIRVVKRGWFKAARPRGLGSRSRLTGRLSRGSRGYIGI